MKTLNENQKQHLFFFNKFSNIENEEIAAIIEKYYKGVGSAYFTELNNELENSDYDELSKNLLLFGNISPEDGCRIYFKEELDSMEDEEIVVLFQNANENGHAIITYFYQNRMFGFDVEELKSTFDVTEDYLREKFSLYFKMKGI